MSNTGKDSSMDGEFQRRKNMLQSDRDASLKDNASMKRRGLISAAAKEARDGATMQRYDRSLEQLMSQRDSGSSAKRVYFLNCITLQLEQLKRSLCKHPSQRGTD